MTTTTMQASQKAQDIETLEAQAEEIAAEVQTFEQQLRDARAQIARAQARFAQLDQERKRLAPKTFGGDSKARVELEALEDEHDEIARATRVARAAEPELAKMLADARERLSAVNVEIRKARAREINYELKEIEQRRDEAATALEEVLKEHSEAAARYEAAVRAYDGDTANQLAVGFSRGHIPWVKKRFGIS